MNINAAIIGMGIGQKHFEAIEGYKNSKVVIICEKDPKIKIVSNLVLRTNDLFLNFKKNIDKI